MSLSCTDSDIYSEIMVENRRFNLPHLYLAPSLGVTPSEFRLDFCLQKTKIHVLLYGVVCVILRLAFLVQYRLVADGRTARRPDGQTHDDSIYRASIASRGNKRK